MIQAVVIVGGRRYPVPAQGLRIGRAPENDVVLPDPNISRQHLMVWTTPNGAFLRDLGSQNGTYVTGRRVGVGPEAVPSGAEVRIGVTTFQIDVVQVPDERAPAMPVAAPAYGGPPAGGSYPGVQPGMQPNPQPGVRPSLQPIPGGYQGQAPGVYGGPTGSASAFGAPGAVGQPPASSGRTNMWIAITIGLVVVALFAAATMVFRSVANSTASATPTATPRPAAVSSTATPVPKPTEGAAKPTTAPAKPEATAAPKPTAPPAKPTEPPAKPTEAAVAPKPSGGRDPGLVRALNAAVRVIVPTGPSSANLGSGSIITAKGHVLTNYHVVADDNGKIINQGNGIIIAVPPNEGDNAQPKYRGRVKEFDSKIDVAVIELQMMNDGSPLPGNLGVTPIPLGSSAGVQIGDSIVIIGFPGLGGSSLTVTRGIHSGIVRFTDSPGSFIKTDTEINHGNSGGTAINTAGELIGIPTAGRFDLEAAGKIGLIRPIDEVKAIIDKATR